MFKFYSLVVSLIFMKRKLKYKLIGCAKLCLQCNFFLERSAPARRTLPAFSRLEVA